MAKGNITTNIEKTNHYFIDGSTGEQLTQQEFNAKYNKGIRNVLGSNRVTLTKEAGEAEVKGEETV